MTSSDLDESTKCLMTCSNFEEKLSYTSGDKWGLCS